MMNTHVSRFQNLLVPPTESEDDGISTDEIGKPSSWTVVGSGRKKQQKTYTKRKKTCSDGELQSTTLSPKQIDVKKRKSGSETKPPCVCGITVESVLKSITCVNCNRSYHIECMKLTGLSAELIRMLENWWCFSCLSFEYTSELNPSQRSMRRLIREELNSVREDIALVKEEVVSATKVVQSTVKKDVKNYADALKTGHKEVLEAATAPALVKNVCQTINVENIERERRRKNIVISRVPEAAPSMNGEQRKAHDLNYICSDKLGLSPNEVVTCFRAGRVRKDEMGGVLPRPLVVVLKTVESSNYWHNDGKGYNQGIHWINEDLCKGDRDAKFFLRLERRKRMQQHQQQKSNQSQ